MSKQVIWKFEIEAVDKSTVMMPKGAQVLDAQIQNGNGQLWVWALCDPEATKEPRWFRVIGTGHDISSLDGYRHVSTVQQGMLVWHLFERRQP